MKAKLAIAATMFAALSAPYAAFADDTNFDPWVIKVGVGDVDPKTHTGGLAGGVLQSSVGSDVKPIITAEYLFTPAWGVEVLASTPWEHDIRLNGALAGTTRQLPPTVSVQYHFNAGGVVSPFVGVGLNWTTFFSTHTDPNGPLAGTRLNLDDSFGGAVHAGLDFRINDKWLITADARWIDIDTDAKVSGIGKVGTVHIDPMVYGVLVGYRF